MSLKGKKSFVEGVLAHVANEKIVTETFFY